MQKPRERTDRRNMHHKFNRGNKTAACDVLCRKNRDKDKV